MANYRQQTSGGLQSEQTCALCYTALTLCYAADVDDLCCGTATEVTVYVPAGQTFDDATNLYATTALSAGALATTGYYSDEFSCDPT